MTTTPTAKSSDKDVWRVGVLFSRSGLMEVTESEHFFGTALAIQEINKAGGVLGREIEVIAYDPGSQPETFRKLADRLLTEDGASVIFGCSTSAERKAVLPAIERRNGLLWYPSLYEGFEYSPNVIYTGPAPNQNAFQLAEYIVRKHGPRVYLIGSDYIYPRESNRIMRDLVESYAGRVVGEQYVTMEAGDAELTRGLDAIREAAPDVVFSTIVGRTAQRFYRMYAAAGFDPKRLPIASLTMAEGEVRAIGAEYCVGHLTAASYFGTLARDSNDRFKTAFAAAFGMETPVSMWSASAYAQIKLFARALEQAGSLDTQKLVEAALGLSLEAPEGPIRIDPDNNHVWVTPRIGRVRADGQFDIVWESKSPIKPDPYLSVSPIGGRWLSEEALSA
ncbi:MAG: transporter substrate-binding domain-containing protein [Bradyrhizobium sp.]|jgi:branched-chain amino acid transport system substrate-binding protein|uniref:Transporter substrate-binding domain-containing protein n=4 Tax=Bradyrhizobium TaxID=374 RepID=A0ABS5G4T2_9BRAD|nr:MULTISPECIES: transporter substrate-binding domain-containing protein [Bradyrhizobium]ABQ35120.1 amino acid/amide ABC transporter substrate-binding protein, HAAT family [Bradyrhizobium sp. BTAi1]MBR1136333.1 transporter substrate-binding domain-containing protein [Bradyrhizobium denitrificans]MDU1492776.1 transporter substrate-binding domain-containing protein [Bradyrhizobium sp.]MDU1543100.1 transporter substrate-binding domain-containing protein [Bradyrhizobium sp.]MDU1690947.1 transporte